MATTLGVWLGPIKASSVRVPAVNVFTTSRRIIPLAAGLSLELLASAVSSTCSQMTTVSPAAIRRAI